MNRVHSRPGSTKLTWPLRVDLLLISLNGQALKPGQERSKQTWFLDTHPPLSVHPFL